MAWRGVVWRGLACWDAACARQEDTRSNLKELSRENALRIDSLINTRNKLRASVEEAKYAGHGGRSGARKMVDELEKAMTIASAEQVSVPRGTQLLQRHCVCGGLTPVCTARPFAMHMDTHTHTHAHLCTYAPILFVHAGAR